MWLLHSVLKPVFWFQPLFYSLHGWLATEMALWLLFHPYEAKYVPGTRWRLPLTPGILPRGRENLFNSIAETVTTTLLTEADIHKQAERLITEDNLLACINAILDSVERELQKPEQIRQIYRFADEMLPELLEQGVNGLIDGLETGKGEKIRTRLIETLAELLPTLRLDYGQAEFLTTLLFDTLITPASLREMLAEGLSDSNILRIEKGLAAQVKGLKGLLVRFMGIDHTLSEWRTFCVEKPDEAELRITELLDKMEVRERLAERISNFSFDNLPEETRTGILKYALTLLTETLVDNRETVSGAVSTYSGAISRRLINRLLQLNPKDWLNEQRPDIKSAMARFLRQYLHRELALMVGRMVPALGIGPMIVDKLNQFSNAELEQMIYGICRRELRWLAFLGAFLGFWLGLMSNLINFFLSH